MQSHTTAAQAQVPYLCLYSGGGNAFITSVHGLSTCKTRTAHSGTQENHSGKVCYQEYNA